MLLADRAGVIRRPVIHHNDFRGRLRCAEARQQCFQRRRFVLRRKDDAERVQTVGSP